MRRILLIAILLLHCVLSVIGITWGLPSRSIDPYLFAGDSPWPGEKIARLAKVASWNDPTRGADVDRNPLAARGEPVDLTATEEDVAAIYLRYRLYTHQPDEMITVRALAGMRPGRLQLDPKLYQYGGLFIYPVGALIKACGLLRLIDVRSDLVYYLDHPDEFGKFYVAARAYVAAWGALGVLLVYAIAVRLRDWKAGLLAALLFTLLPVVICMSHEAKPHLPGAVLMLAAVWFAIRYLDLHETWMQARRSWILMCVACGAALGMVLSSWPIFLLIPVIEFMRPVGGTLAEGDERAGANAAPRFCGAGPRTRRTIMGTALALGVYFASNPYVAINAFANRAVLRSNFGNSLAMYEFGRLGEGLLRVLELLVEGAGLPVVLVGLVGGAAALLRRQRAAAPLIVAASAFFLQFVAIGAGKPDEYGRFGIFPCAALAISTACVLARRWTRLRAPVNSIPAVFAVVWTAFCGYPYTRNLHLDTFPLNSRTRGLEDAIRRRELQGACVVAFREPAPYCCPPLPFSSLQVLYFTNGSWSFLETREVAQRAGPYLSARPGQSNQWRDTRYTYWVVTSEEESSRQDPRSFNRRLADVMTHRYPYFDWSLRGAWARSPISWANYPVMFYPPRRVFP